MKQNRVFGSPPIVCAAVAIVAAIALAGVFAMRHAPSGSSHTKAAIEIEREQLSLVDGQLCFRGTSNPFTGTMTEHYEGGLLRSRSTVSNGWLHGLSEGWHTNGQVQVTEHFRQGVSHGVRTKYYMSGTRLSQASIVDGKLDGPFHRWHENGQLAELIQFSAGRPEGLSLSFHPGGSPKARVHLSEGQVIAQEFWDDPAPQPERLPNTETLAQR